MGLWKRFGAISLLLLVTAIGMAFGSLPRNWIELRFGVDLDGGNGFLEFLLAAIPIGVCIALAIRKFTRHSSLTSEDFGRSVSQPQQPTTTNQN
jgi:hypothetical protein